MVLQGLVMLTNFIEFFYRIFEWYDKGDLREIIYIDFSKGFNIVSHKTLIKKLEGYGIQGMS